MCICNISTNYHNIKLVIHFIFFAVKKNPLEHIKKSKKSTKLQKDKTHEPASLTWKSRVI
jgi:hypothetical protein